MRLLKSIRNHFGFRYAVLDGAPALTADQERGLALGAVDAVEGHLPTNALTLGTDPRKAARLAGETWGVVDAESARETYRALLDGGQDRVYQVVLPYLERHMEVLTAGDGRGAVKASRDGAERELTGVAAHHGLDAEQVVRGFVNGATYFGFQQKHPGHQPLPQSVVAWDAAQVVLASRAFVDAGFVTADDAWRAIDAAVELSRPAYLSWTEFSAGYRTGLLFSKMLPPGFTWRKVGPDSLPFIHAADHLDSRDDSPWRRLPW